MNSAIMSFRLIIVHDSAQEAQRLSSMLHNAGKPCRVQHIHAEANLTKILEELSWDLLIAYDNSQALTPALVIRTIRKFERDIPVILLTEESHEKSVVDGMKLGACDVAQVDDDQHLLLIIERELAHRQERKQTRITQRKLKEVQRRNQSLLDSSRDGIAFVQDGMYLYANKSFAEMLGYEEKDDIEFMPIMDYIDDADHAHVKNTLKNFALQKHDAIDEEASHLSFNALMADGTTKAMTAELFIGEHEEESCTQLVCYSQLQNQELIEAELATLKNIDPVTGLYNRAHLIEAVERAVDIAARDEISQSFIFIDVDRFSRKIKSSLNITDTDILLEKISTFIKGHYGKDDIIGRVSDHSFAVISPEHDPNKLVNSHNTLCKKFADHLFEIGNKTIQMSLSIGIGLINESTTDSQILIQHALKSIETLRKNQDGNGVDIYQKDANDSDILASSMTKALENDDFNLLFQPILSLRGGETERYEVLLRMVIDDKEVHPTQFLNIAEGLNLSKKIDRWVLLESIKHLQKSKSGKQNIQQFINVSSSSLCDETLLPWLKVAIEAAKIKPESLVLQAKEADVIQHLTAARTFVDNAKAIGIDFSITNFGIAMMDSLSTLQHIDAQHIKLDSGLSQELQENPDNLQPLEELVNALHKENKITTIPHVEKASILSTLWQLGVHCIQGNYLQPPSAAMDYEFTTDE